MKSLILAFLITSAQAAPIASLRQGDLVLTLTDEPCTLSAVSNLPSRATWDEKGKILEGCYGRRGDMLLFYFSDLTVIDIPMHVFRRTVGI